MSPKKLSIAIPTWGSYGKGDEFIDDLLRTIEIQTFKNFEVCISDHCKDDMVLEVVQKFSKKFKIKYLKNTKDHGNGPANTNKAIDMCEGEVIKVMFQDDCFYDDEALEKIYTSLHNSDRMWLLNGCNHTYDDGWNFVNEMNPSWNPRLLEGVNTISAPSVLAFKKGVTNRFDKNLTYFMDCEFYYGMYERYGEPIYLNDCLITNRVGEYSVTTNVSHKNRDFYVEKETKYCKEKYDLINA